MTVSAVSRDTEAYAAAFEEIAGGARARAEAPWIRKLRSDAFTRFQELGFPAPDDEAWKYTSVTPITRTEWRIAPPEPRGHRSPTIPLDLSASMRLVFVNGRLSMELSSDLGALPDGVELASMAAVLRDHPDWLQPFLGRCASSEKSALTAWNTAFFEDGAFVRIRRDAALREPVELVFVAESEPGAGPFVSHLRNLIVADPHSEASVVETYVGDGLSLTNAVTEIALETGSSLHHYKVQRESLQAVHLQTIAATASPSSRYTSHNVALGSSLARTEIGVVLDGAGAECELNGLFVGGGSQHLDTHTTIDHAKPHGSSRELYKGILDGRARGVFHGTILVRKDAQKTDAMQTNRNLLLSKEALVNSTPALEIFADDVKCRHGSTIGQLDEAAMFYLLSRGIGEEDARAILTWAFAEDVVRRIRIPQIRAGVEAALGLRLPGADIAAATP
ncbi:MAG: Fe-S cluster assembly protein SufD [Acidobacteriota bacterium]|nr:Fe-S cluster assembly protein SufD [Acidobacteriota bacterium]